MDLTFVQTSNMFGRDGAWETEFSVDQEFNLHLERESSGKIIMMQKTAGTFFDIVKDFDMKSGDVVYDYDSASFLGTKTIKIVSESAIRFASLTTSGEVTEIKSQSKEIEVTSNGTTEVTPDAGFAYLNSVKVKTNVAQGGGSGGGELEGEYFLAKPNGRYWKFTFMPEGHHLRIEDFEASQIGAMINFYDILFLTQGVSGAAVSTDDISLTNELAKVDGFYNVGARINSALQALKSYTQGFNYSYEGFNEGFLRVWKECDINSNPPAEIELGGIVIPPFSNLIELMKGTARLQGMEITDDEAILLLEQSLMITPATEEEYKYWRMEE